MKKIKNILIFGTQGSGKDTQSELLSKKRKVSFIVTGEMFRQEVRKGTGIGKKIANLMKSGKLVSDEITLALLKKRLSKKDLKKGYILNGFPRNKKQLELADKILRTDLAIELKISDKEALRRITGRRVCPKCGATYHLVYCPPKRRGFCDKCGSLLITRNDDKPDMVRKRLKIYHQKTEPLFKTYQKMGAFLKVNGEKPIPMVFKEMIKKISVIEK